jgi:monovalent cation:H+ antiporter-2, CPA2 family
MLIRILIFLLQVETFAQFGVVFLLFALGLEFSLTKVLKKALCFVFI